MLVAQVLAAVERLAPPALAEDWDNVGLIVGRHNQPVRRLLVALELRGDVLGEAREHGCDAILTHHPPIFPSIHAVTDGAAGELVLRAAEDRLAVLAAHTNLDAARGGLNDVMAEILGMSAAVPLRPDPDDAVVRPGAHRDDPAAHRERAGGGGGAGLRRRRPCPTRATRGSRCGGWRAAPAPARP